MPVLRTRYDERTGHAPNNPRQQVNHFFIIIVYHIKICNFILYSTSVNL